MRIAIIVLVLIFVAGCSPDTAKGHLQADFPNAKIFTIDDGHINFAFLTKEGDFYYADYNGNHKTINTLVFSAGDNVIEQRVAGEGDMADITSTLIEYHGTYFLYRVAERYANVGERYANTRRTFVLAADRSVWFYKFDGGKLDERFNVTTLPATEETREPYIDFTKTEKE